MKISVFTDLRFTESTTPTGVGKHIAQMVWGLSRIEGNDISVLAARDQIRGKALRPTSTLSYLPAQKLPLPWKAAEALWTLAGGPAVDGYCKGADWVYCAKNDFIPLRRTKLAVTIHGAHELDPSMPQQNDWRSKLNRARRLLSYRRIIDRADLVLTVSEFLKAQTIDWFGCDEGKIAVVGNGVEEVFFSAAELPPGVSGRSTDLPYLLCVGGLNVLDGGDRVLDVALLLARTQPEVRIVVAGWQHDEHLLARAHVIPNIELLGYVPAAKLALLMRDAIALLYLTKYETFGIAAAEAMAVGTPVITSGSTAVPEVVGDAGLYVSDDPQNVLDQIRRVLEDSDLCVSLRSAGRGRSREFTWQACVYKLQTALQGGC